MPTTLAWHCIRADNVCYWLHFVYVLVIPSCDRFCAIATDIHSNIPMLIHSLPLCKYYVFYIPMRWLVLHIYVESHSCSTCGLKPLFPSRFYIACNGNTYLHWPLLVAFHQLTRYAQWEGRLCCAMQPHHACTYHVWTCVVIHSPCSCVVQWLYSPCCQHSWLSSCSS